MNKILRNSLLAGAVVSTSLFTTGIAQALQLDRNEEPFLTFHQLVNEEKLQFNEGSFGFFDIDPTALTVLNSSDPIEVYFIDEGAFFLNKLSYTASDGSSDVVFEEVSSTESILPEANGVLDLGEGTSIGTFAKGTELDFFITPKNPINGRLRAPLGTDPTTNPGGLDYAFARSAEVFNASLGKYETWTVLGFEDNTSAGSDRDFNDVVFAVKGIGEAKAVPEPATLLGLLGVAALGATTLRRRDA